MRRMVPAQADPQLGGLLVLTPAPGGKRAKNLNLTEAGRALAEKTIARVVRAEAAAIVSRMARTEQRLLLWS